MNAEHSESDVPPSSDGSGGAPEASRPEPNAAPGSPRPEAARPAEAEAAGSRGGESPPHPEATAEASFEAPEASPVGPPEAAPRSSGPDLPPALSSDPQAPDTDASASAEPSAPPTPDGSVSPSTPPGPFPPAAPRAAQVPPTGHTGQIPRVTTQTGQMPAVTSQTGQMPTVPGHTTQLPTAPPMGPPPPGQPPAGAAPYGSQPPKKRGVGAGAFVAGALVVALLAGGTGGAVGYLLADGGGDDSPSSVVGDNATISDVAKAVQPSVVDITSDKAEGSGVIYDDQGHIITNNHVASSGSDGKLKVTFADGSTAQAHITGTDPSGDLAVIQVDDAKDLTPIKFGDSDKLDVGDTVLAIGSPLGLQGSVTSGIVSAKDRTVQAGGEDGTTPTTLQGMIQTDAAINPGNSGGALVNGKGQLVGINTIIATAGNSEGSVGLGFAIASSTVKDDAEKLIKDGNGGNGGGNGVIKHAYLGVSVTDNVKGDGGAIVSSVQPGTPAAKAGLKQGDVITKIGDKDVKSASDVVSTVQGAKPGDKMDVTYTRGGDSKTVTVKLASSPTN